MKRESMASNGPDKAKTKLPKVPQIKGRRATSPGWITNGLSDINSSHPFSRRKMSVDSTLRNLFPDAMRSSYDEVLPAEHYTSTKVDQPVKLLIGERELGQKPITIMSVLRLNVEKYPERQAYAHKPDDKWQFITYKDLFDRVWLAAKGLISFGLSRHAGVAIIGSNCPEWVIANFAAIYAGGIVVPIAAAVSANDCCSIMQNTQCNILVVGSAKHLDTYAQIRSQLPYIKAVINYCKDIDEKSVHCHTWNQLMAMGENVDDERLKERMAFQAPNLCCTIVHTPGTTGPPKPVMLSQDNIIWTARSLGRRLSCSIASGRMMCILTYAHDSSLVATLYVPLLFASTVFFISTPNIFEWTKEIRPTSFYAPRLVFEELRLRMTSHLTRSCFTRIIYWWARTIGFRGYKAITTGRPMPICWSLANALVYRKIRTMLGLQDSREIFIGGRMISEESLKFFASLNIPVLEIYGMTESSGPITVSSIPDMFRITSVGKDIDGCFTKIVQPDKEGLGSLLIRGRHVFMGYLDQPEKTNEVFDSEGWHITGDLAKKDDDGFLYVTGKVSDVVTLENGERIHSGPIETSVREALPVIRHCLLVGNGKSYLAMLMTFKTVVDWQTLEVSNVLTPDSRQWFQQLGYHDETIDRFLLNPDKRILNKIQSVIDQQNAREQQPSHRIGKWTILPRDLTVKSGELTWTYNIRRFIVEKIYAETINSLYIAEK